MSFFNNFAATAARQALNSSYLQPYGSLVKLEIDAKKHTLGLVLELKGESQPLEIQIKRYELSEQDGETFLAIREVETSREWVNTLLREHLLDKVINPRLKQTPLPSMVKMLL